MSWTKGWILQWPSFPTTMLFIESKYKSFVTTVRAKRTCPILRWKVAPQILFKDAASVPPHKMFKSILILGPALEAHHIVFIRCQQHICLSCHTALYSLMCDVKWAIQERFHGVMLMVCGHRSIHHKSKHLLLNANKEGRYNYIVFNYFDNGYFPFPGGKVLNKITRKECLALIMIEGECCE